MKIESKNKKHIKYNLKTWILTMKPNILLKLILGTN